MDISRMKQTDKSITTAFLLIIMLSIFLRFWDLEIIPRWYSDEGTELNIAWNLVNGHIRMFAITYTFVPHPPLFFIVAGIGLKIFGNELVVLRMLTATYGVLTTILLYFIGKELFNKRVGLLASFLFAIYPTALIYNRIAFTHNQFMFLSILTFYVFLRYINTRRDRYFYLTCVCVAMSLVSEYTAIVSFISLFLLSFLYDRKGIKTAIVTSLAPVIVLVVLMLILYPTYFVKDVLFQFKRIGFVKLIFGLELIAISLVIYLFKKQIKHISKNILAQLREDFSWLFKDYAELIKPSYILIAIICFFAILDCQSPQGILTLPYTESIYMYGIFGLFLIDHKQKRNTAFLFFIPLLGLFCVVTPNINRILPILPYFALGLAIMVFKVYELFLHHAKLSGKISQVLVAILLIHPFLFITYNDVSAFLDRHRGDIEPIEDDLAIAKFINERVDSEDIVLAPPYIYQLIQCHTTHLHQAEAIQGKPTYDLGYINPERFLFNCSYRNAKFIIIDNSTRKESYIEQPPLREIDSEIKRWPMHLIGEYIIYENPSKMVNYTGYNTSRRYMTY